MTTAVLRVLVAALVSVALGLLGLAWVDERRERRRKQADLSQSWRPIDYERAKDFRGRGTRRGSGAEK